MMNDLPETAGQADLGAPAGADKPAVPAKRRGRPAGAKAKKPAPKKRTAAAMSPVEAEVSNLDLGQDRATAAHAPDRPARVRMEASKILDVPFELDTVNFYYRWFRESRIVQAQQAWYEVVNQPESGEACKRVMGASTSVLMRLPIEHRLEDLQFKREAVIKTTNTKETGGITDKDSEAPDYSALEGRSGAVQIKGGHDPDAPYNAYT